MTIIDVTEELVSEVDVNAEFNKQGLLVSVLVDEVEVREQTHYDLMAYAMVADQDKYPHDVLATIKAGLINMVDILDEALLDE